MLLYALSMLLTWVDIIGFFASAAALYIFYSQGKLTNEGIMLFGGICVGTLILLPIIGVIRRKSRMASKYDKYGRMKQISKYEKMSVQEQKEFEKTRMKELERLLPSTFVREITKRGSSNPDEDLQNLIGLQTVKTKVEEMEARMEMESRGRKNNSSNLARHMVFFGPPGTGKTTVAAVMTAYLKKYRFIQDNRFLQVNGSFFSGTDAPAKIEAIVQRAFGGVLFIDEAYAILQGPYGDDAISTLLSQMEDNRDKFVLIMAGYEDEMKELLRSNPGFLSRVSEFLYFSNYNIQELTMIFKSMAKKEGYSVDGAGEDAFGAAVYRAMQERSFGNARTCRTILDKSISRHCLNIKRAKQKENGVLTGEDIIYESNPLAN